MTKTRDLADLGGGFIQEGTGAVQRTVENKLQESFSVRDFGAVGDGVTDDYLAFQACADAAVAKSIAEERPIGVFIPAGDYLISDQVVFDVSPQNETNRGIVLYGEGMQASRLIASTSNTAGLIKMTGDGNTEIWEVRDISLLSPLAFESATNNGTALYIESTVTEGDPGFGSHAYRSVIISNVHIGPYAEDVLGLNDGSIGHWYRGIDIRNKWLPVIMDTVILGSQYSASASGHNAGAYLKYCYSPEFINCYFQNFWTYGVYLDCITQEDFRVESCFFVNQTHGFYMARPSSYDSILYEPGGSIINSHMACRTNNIYIERHRQINIIGNYLYVPTDTSGLPACIRLVRTGDIVIANNQFLEPGFYTNTSNATCGIRFSNAAQGIVVHGCHFNHGGIGILVDSGTTGGNFGDNMVTVYNCTSKGQGTWTGPTHKILDNTGIVNCKNWVEQTEGDTTFTSSFVYGTTGSNPCEDDKVLYSRADFASNTAGKLLDKRIAGLMSNGNQAQFARSYEFIDNTSTNPILAEKIYQTTAAGVTEVGRWHFSTSTDTTPFMLLHKFGAGSGDIALKRVEVGAADSGGTGYRLLRVAN